MTVGEDAGLDLDALTEPREGQVWERKADGVKVRVVELTGSSHSFLRVQRLDNGRHYEATRSGLLRKYELLEGSPS